MLLQLMCHNPSTSAGKFSLARHHPCRICSQQVKLTHALCSEDILPPWGFLKQCISKPMPLIARCSKTDVFLVFFFLDKLNQCSPEQISCYQKKPQKTNPQIFFQGQDRGGRGGNKQPLS